MPLYVVKHNEMFKKQGKKGDYKGMKEKFKKAVFNISRKIIRKNSILKQILLVFSIIIMVAFITQPGQTKNRTVTDMAGRKIELPEKVERVITTYRTASQFIFALGAQDRLVAAATGFSKQKLFSALLPDSEQIPTVGSKRKGLNLEEIIAAEPDLVILFPYGDGPESAKKLAEQGIVSLIIKPESYQEIRETNLLIGRVLNLEKEAAAVDRELFRILKLADRTGDIPEENRKIVYFANSNLLDTVGAGMLQTNIIELAGGINPAREIKKGFIKTSPEELFNWNPDFIITSNKYQGEIDELKNSTPFQSIKAFRDENIYRIPCNLESWDFPGPSSYLMVIWLADKLYPEKFKDIDLNKLIDQFYLNLYGKSFTRLGGRL